MRGLTGEGEEFTCTTVDVCAGGLRINLARPLAVGENLVLYIDDIGRVEGVVARALNEIGYAIEFKVPPRKRDKIADQLTWLINKDRLGLSDEREAERRPGGGQVIAIYNGVSIACAVADVSIQGRAAGGVTIVNLGSGSWLMGSEDLSAYATAKSAAYGLTRVLAREFGKDNIRVNCVIPGWIMTERQLALWVDKAGEEAIARNQVLKRKLVPDDIAKAVLFLASEQSSGMTNQQIIVDGGWY